MIRGKQIAACVALAWLALPARASAPEPVELGRGPVATTTVAVTVELDPQGHVVSCKPGVGGEVACSGFPKGRMVSTPLRRNGRPVAGMMTISTTSVISAR